MYKSSWWLQPKRSFTTITFTRRYRNLRWNQNSHHLYILELPAFQKCSIVVFFTHFFQKDPNLNWTPVPVARKPWTLANGHLANPASTNEREISLFNFCAIVYHYWASKPLFQIMSMHIAYLHIIQGFNPPSFGRKRCNSFICFFQKSLKLKIFGWNFFGESFFNCPELRVRYKT